MKRYFILKIFAAVVVISNLAGCDQVYRLLQKEGAEEKDLLGEVIPFESNLKVLEIQKLLKLYGYNPGAVDGKFGANTRLAIEKFQTDNSLPVNRFVDQKTWQLLNVFSQSGLVADASVNIAKVQLALKTAGFNPGKIDGKLGSRTLIAVKEFQQARHLAPDGRMGFKTLSQLLKYLAPAPSKGF